jgi:hypothetical protein
MHGSAPPRAKAKAAPDPKYVWEPRRWRIVLPPAASPLAPSIVEYQRIHAVGWFLNRLLRGLHNETPDNPLLLAAKIDAENRYNPPRPAVAAIWKVDPATIAAGEGLPSISIQARRPVVILQRQVNSEIKRAIRRVEKTKAGKKWFGEIAEQQQLRCIVELSAVQLDQRIQKKISRRDLGTMTIFCGRSTGSYSIHGRLIAQDDLVVPRWWPMQWCRGVYVPLAAPHNARKRPKPTLEKIEHGGKAAWARLSADLGVPPAREGKPLFEEPDDRRGKMVRALVSRQRRKPTRLRTFAELRTVSPPLWYTESRS